MRGSTLFTVMEFLVALIDNAAVFIVASISKPQMITGLMQDPVAQGVAVDMVVKPVVPVDLPSVWSLFHPHPGKVISM